MKTLILSIALAFGLSACGPNSEEVRSDLEQKIAFAQTAVTFGAALAPVYTARPDCVEGGTVLCKDPVIAIAITEALAAGRELLADARAVVAEGLTDEERVALVAAALIKFADNLTALLDKINAPAEAVDT